MSVIEQLGSAQFWFASLQQLDRKHKSPLDEFAGMFAMQSLRGDPDAVYLDIEQPVAPAAPIARLQGKLPIVDVGVEFEESVGPRVTAGPEAKWSARGGQRKGGMA